MGHLLTSTPLKSPVFSRGVHIERLKPPLGCITFMLSFVQLRTSKRGFSTQRNSPVAGTKRALFLDGGGERRLRSLALATNKSLLVRPLARRTIGGVA
jgi:hypothetical protein